MRIKTFFIIFLVSFVGLYSETKTYNNSGVIYNDKVYIFGGNKEDPTPVSQMGEHYIPEDASNEVLECELDTSLCKVVGYLSKKRYGHAAFLIKGQKVLILGGNVSKVETYDLKTNATTIIENLSFIRRDFTSHQLSDGNIVMIGGIEHGTEPTNAIELYNTETNKISKISNLFISRFNHSSSLLSGDQILILGGTTIENNAKSQDKRKRGRNLNEVELFNYKTSVVQMVGSMNQIRTFPTSQVFENDYVLVSGGMMYNTVIPTEGNFLTNEQERINYNLKVKGSALQSAEVYDPAQKKFTLVGEMNFKREGHTMTLLDDGNILVAGGWGARFGDRDFTDSIQQTEIFDVQTKKFKLSKNLRFPRSRHTAYKIKNKGIFFHGGISHWPFGKVSLPETLQFP